MNKKLALNPLRSNLFVRNYLIFSAILILFQFFILYLRLEFAWAIALTDSLISITLLNGMLLSLWFVVRYARYDQISSISSVLNSIAAGVLIIAVWYFLSYFLLRSIFYEYPDYKAFLDISRGIRIVVALFVSGLIYLTFFLILYQHSINEAIQRENSLKLLVQRTELQALKNQLNPHFIYNSLNSISSLTLYSPQKAREMISLLSDFLRIALRQDATSLTRLREEVKNITLYLQIEKIRFEDKLNWIIEVDEGHLNYQLPALILQPLFENAVKHGIQHCSEKGTIRMFSYSDEDHLYITVENTYDVTFHRFKGEGVGIENVRNRLKVIYQKTDLLSIGVDENLFRVKLKIPLSA
ncbi:MAG: sensor histidine kinase [Bacteroidota bacterium]